MNITPLTGNGKVMLLFPKGEKPDFMAAREAFFKLIDEDWQKVQENETFSNGWEEYANSADELKDEVGEEFDELDKLVKSNDGDGFYFIQLNLPKSDAWVFWSMQGVGDDISGSTLTFMLSILQFDAVAQALGGSFKEI